MKSLLVCVLLSSSLAAQTFVAHVNDPLSHGMVGDGKLSLDEAIQVLNTQLQLNQLSAAEQAQITGTGTWLDAIEVDAGVTPTITLERLLTPIDGPAAHHEFELEGVEGASGKPVLDGGTLDVVLRLRTNHAHIHGFALFRGKSAVIADASVHLHPGEHVHIEECEIHDQSVEGVRLQAAGAGATTPGMVMHTELSSMPVGIVIDDQSTDGEVMFMGEWLDFDGVALGIDVSTQGQRGTTQSMLFRSDFHNGTTVLKVRRSPASTQRLMLMLVEGTYETTGDTVDCQGNAVGDNILHHHHLTVKPATGKRAFYIWPQDGRFDFHGSENVIYGDQELLTGRLNRRLWFWNSVFRDGTITLSNEGVQSDCRWNVFENCTIRVLGSNVTRMPMASSEFYGCTIDGQSAQGPIALDNCWLERSTVQGQASHQNDAPSPWLGYAQASTKTPQLGGPLNLTLKLPAGMGGIWLIGESVSRPVLTEEPWRFYFDVNVMAQLRGLYVGTTTVHLTVPPDPMLLGIEYYFQPVTFPLNGQAHVPAFNLPRGAYVRPVQ